MKSRKQPAFTGPPLNTTWLGSSNGFDRFKRPENPSLLRTTLWPMLFYSFAFYGLYCFAVTYAWPWLTHLP